MGHTPELQGLLVLLLCLVKIHVLTEDTEMCGERWQQQQQAAQSALPLHCCPAAATQVLAGTYVAFYRHLIIGLATTSLLGNCWKGRPRDAFDHSPSCLSIAAIVRRHLIADHNGCNTER